jgi:hypothetical protein
MTAPAGARPPLADPEALGGENRPLCREPWMSFYILRRGVMPCCYGFPVDEFITDYARVWNSPKLQEIRSYLAKGKLSPYCLKCLSCPIVQRELAKKDGKSGDPDAPVVVAPKSPLVLRLVNRALFRLPAKLVRAFKKR